MSNRFQSTPAKDRIVRTMGPMTLVYHRTSGITHMIGEPVPQILDALDALGDTDAATVTRHLAVSFDLQAEDASVEAIVAARLEELAALGLVTRAP